MIRWFILFAACVVLVVGILLYNEFNEQYELDKVKLERDSNRDMILNNLTNKIDENTLAIAKFIDKNNHTFSNTSEELHKESSGTISSFGPPIVIN